MILQRTHEAINDFSKKSLRMIFQRNHKAINDFERNHRVAHCLRDNIFAEGWTDTRTH